MPCTYTGSLEGDRTYFCKEELKKVRKEVDLVTRLLCETMTYLHSGTSPYDYASTVFEGVLQIEGMAAWWKAHQRRDARRKSAKSKKR